MPHSTGPRRGISSPGRGSPGWLYVVADGGFIVQAIGLLAAFVWHANDRWPGLFSMRTEQLRTATRGQRRLAAVTAAGVAAMTVAWSVTDGPSWGGPAGFETVTQKTFLLTNGLLVLAGAIAVPALLGRRGRGVS